MGELILPKQWYQSEVEIIGVDGDAFRTRLLDANSIGILTQQTPALGVFIPWAQVRFVRKHLANAGKPPIAGGAPVETSTGAGRGSAPRIAPTPTRGVTLAQLGCLRSLASRKGAPSERWAIDFPKLSFDEASMLIRRWQKEDTSPSASTAR